MCNIEIHVGNLPDIFWRFLVVISAVVRVVTGGGETIVVTQQDLGDTRGYGQDQSGLTVMMLPPLPLPLSLSPSLTSNKYFMPLQMIVVIFEDGRYLCSYVLQHF